MKIIEIDDIKDLFKKRDINANKGNFGKAGLYGGSIEYSGALKLSYLSLSALRSGCGISRVLVKKEVLLLLGPNILEQTLCILPDYNDSFYDTLNNYIKDLDSLAFGMGLGSDKHLEEALEFLIKNYTGNLIIDADGLNTLSQMDMNILKTTKSKIVLTPHLKEFERLSKISVEKIKQNPIQVAKDFAQKYNITLLLKGATTIVTNGEKTYLVKKAVPGMATAGSGDVLSGIITGMLGYQENNLLTVSAGAMLACIAGEFAQAKYTDISMKASDTIENIPNAIKYIREN